MRRMAMAAMLATTMIAGASQAAVQVVSFSGSGSAVAMMPLFDSALGTLQSVNITASYLLKQGFASWGSTPADRTVSGLFALGSLNFALTGSTLTTMDYGPYGTFTIAGSGATTFSQAADLSLLTGASPIGLGAQVYAAAPGSPLGGSPMANVQYSISYSYDDRKTAVRTTIASPGAVPEPASWALMITGFGLTGTALRRAKRTMRSAIVAG